MSERRCETCRWWLDHHNVGWEGQCRRYPPIQTHRADDGEFLGIFPVVDNDDWCGEYQPKEEG